MDPLSAKVGGGGLSNLSGELSKTSGKPGSGGKFESVRMDKQSDPMSKADRMLDNFQKTGHVSGAGQAQAPSMAERVAARDGIAFQPNLNFAHFDGAQATSTAWAPQQVQATGQTQQVAGAVQGLNEGQARLEQIIGELKSGKEYSQTEILGLQAEVNVLSEQLQMSTKLVDSAMQSIKSVMQQQV
jgi:hypothetical protein